MAGTSRVVDRLDPDRAIETSSDRQARFGGGLGGSDSGATDGAKELTTAMGPVCLWWCCGRREPEVLDGTTGLPVCPPWWRPAGEEHVASSPSAISSFSFAGSFRRMLRSKRATSSAGIEDNGMSDNVNAMEDDDDDDATIQHAAMWKRQNGAYWEARTLLLTEPAFLGGWRVKAPAAEPHRGNRGSTPPHLRGCAP